jgi:hypothetical protein
MNALRLKIDTYILYEFLEIRILLTRQCPFAWCKTFGPNALIRG